MNNHPTPTLAPPPAPARPNRDHDLRRLADGRTLAGVAVIALLTDMALRAGLASLGSTLVIAATAGALVVAGRLVNRQAMGAAFVAVAFGALATVRTSTWLVPFDLMAATGLLVLAAAHASGGSLFDLGVRDLFGHAGRAMWQGRHGPRYVARAFPPPTKARGVLRGAAIAAPLVGILGVLLGSADAVFASFFDVPLGFDVVTGHVILVAMGAWLATALLRLAVTPLPPACTPRRGRLGQVEATVVLGSVVALYAVFALAQVVAMLGGADQVFGQAGLTRAEYARSGFFQLLAVSAITLLTLRGGRAAMAAPAGRLPTRLLALALTAVALTLVIVAVAVGRLDLYQDAYGMTMLRLSTTVTAVWLAVVFVLLGISFTGVAAGRRWFVPVSVLSGLVLLAGLNLVNPEAIVSRHNVQHAATAVRFDIHYLTALSDDSVPALIDALPLLPREEQEMLVSEVCAKEPEGGTTGWGFHLGRKAAAEARAPVCPRDERWNDGEASPPPRPLHPRDLSIYTLGISRSS